MHKKNNCLEKDVGATVAILKHCHVVLENLDLKLPSRSTSLVSDLPHMIIEMQNEICSEPKRNSCSNIMKLNKFYNGNSKKQTETSDIQSNELENEQVLDSFHPTHDEISASGTDIDNSYSVKATKFNKYDKQCNSVTCFEKHCTLRKINIKSFGKGLKGKREVCSPEPIYKFILNHSNISSPNQCLAENLKYLPKNVVLKQCAVFVTKIDLSKICAMKDAVTLKSSSVKWASKRSSCSSVNSINSVLTVSDSFKSVNHQSYAYDKQTLINDTNSEENSGNLKRRCSIDSSSTDFVCEMNHANYSKIADDNYSKDIALELNNFKTENEQVLDSFHPPHNEISSSGIDIDNSYSVKATKFNKYDKQCNSVTYFEKHSTLRKINMKSIGKGLKGKREICFPETTYKCISNHSSISLPNQCLAENLKYLPKNVVLKQCAVFVAKIDLSKICAMKNAVTLKSSIVKRDSKRSSCSSVNSSNSVLTVSDSHKSVNRQSSHAYDKQTLINDTNSEENSGNLKRRCSIDSSSTDFVSEMNRTNYSKVADDNYSKDITLELNDFKTKFHEHDAEPNTSTSSLLHLCKSCNVDNFSDTDIYEKEINYPLTYFARKFKRDVSGSGSESNFIDSSEERERRNSEMSSNAYIFDAKREMRNNSLHSDTSSKNHDLIIKRQRGQRNKFSDFEMASNYSDCITKTERRKHSDSKVASYVHALNYSDSKAASNYSNIPYDQGSLRREYFPSEVSLNCTDSGNDSNYAASSKSGTALDFSNCTRNAKRSRRKHSDSETSLNCSDSNSEYKKRLRKKYLKSKTASKYPDHTIKVKRNRRKKHSDSETSLNYSDSNYSNFKFRKNLKKKYLKLKTASNSSDLASNARRSRRNNSDSETCSNHSDSISAKKNSRKKYVNFKASLKCSDSKLKKKQLNPESYPNCSVSISYAKRHLRRKHLDSRLSLNSDFKITSGYCNSTTKHKGNKRNKPLHFKASNYSNSIYKNERNGKNKVLEHRTTSYSDSVSEHKRSKRQKLSDSDTSSSSDLILKCKRSRQQRVLDSEVSSNSSVIISKFKDSTKSLDSETSLNLCSMQISPHLSDCETESNSSITTVLTSDIVKSSHKKSYVYDNVRYNDNMGKYEELNNRNKIDEGKNTKKSFIGDFYVLKDNCKACKVILTRLELNYNNNSESSNMRNVEEYDHSGTGLEQEHNPEVTGRDMSAASVNDSSVQNVADNDSNFEDHLMSHQKITGSETINRKCARFISDNEKSQHFFKESGEHGKDNAVSFLESSCNKSSNDKNIQEIVNSDCSNYTFKNRVGKNYVIDMFDFEGIEKLFVTVNLKSDFKSEENIKCSKKDKMLVGNNLFNCKKSKYNIHSNKVSKKTDSSSPKKSSKTFYKSNELQKDDSGKCDSVSDLEKKSSKDIDLQKIDTGNCESVFEPDLCSKKQPARDGHSEIFISSSNTSVISNKSHQKSTKTIKQKLTNQIAHAKIDTKFSVCSGDSCIQCFTKFYTLQESYNHVCSGKQKRGYLCIYCERIFPSYKSIQIHERIHKNGEV